VDDRLYRVRLPRAPGIEWGTDLSFCFVSVREMDPTGAAFASGQVSVGDQICEMREVAYDSKDDTDDTTKLLNMVGAPFDAVMGGFANLSKETREVDFVFFRGTKDELKDLCKGQGSAAQEEPEFITVTVQEMGNDDKPPRILTAPVGSNVRQLLVDNDINVYQSLTRWTNCKGKQLCGTCIVNIAEGSTNTNRKSMDEASTLRENPDSYRLSCITFAYGDVTVETFPPIQASQWTR
jgi:ferredoxin